MYVLQIAQTNQILSHKKKPPQDFIRKTLAALARADWRKGCLVLTNLSRNILTVYLAEFQDFPSDKEIFLWYHGNSTGL